MTVHEPELTVVIRRKIPIANNIIRFDLERADGGVLPACVPGAHIAVRTPAGSNRWYSIFESSDSHYSIAVKREESGRGGSLSMADDTCEGDTLSISEPDCEFDFVDADAYLLIAGGIGITPIYSMWQHLVASGHPDFRLIYLTRSAEETAFREELLASPFADRVEIFHSAEAGDRYDFWDLFEKPTAQYIYCCGPKSLMEEIQDMTGHWPSSRIHFEDFKPVEVIRADDQPFTVRLQGQDESIEVKGNETMLDALRRHGYRVHSSCESGTCGSCRISYSEGAVEHRDLVLQGDQTEQYLMACVSRAKGDTITIDPTQFEQA